MTDIIANIPDAQLERIGSKIVATLSQQLTWSHFLEFAVIPEPNKRLFYQQMSILGHWSISKLREQEDAMAYERTLMAQYLTVLPDKQWFIDKLNRSIQIARELQANNG